MPNQLHLESLKKELANAEIKNRQLAVYSNNAIDLLSELMTAFLHNNERYTNKVKSFIDKKPEFSLAENNAQVIRNLIYSVTPPVDFSLSRTEIVEKLRSHADNLDAVE